MNKLGAPTKPTRKIDDFMLFITANEALDKNFDYLMFGLDINADQLAGLDSYTSPEDENMLNYFKESKKRQAH